MTIYARYDKDRPALKSLLSSYAKPIFKSTFLNFRFK